MLASYSDLRCTLQLRRFKLCVIKLYQGVARCGFNGGVASILDLNMVPEAIAKKLEPMGVSQAWSL